MLFPFSAPAGDVALNTLADALTGDVSRALANSLRDVRVVAPNPATVQKGKAFDERALGREANVRYVVAGEMRGTGDDIVVTARLIDTTTAKELASERRAIARARINEDHELLVARLTSATRVMFWNAEGRRLATEPTVATDPQSLVERADAIFTGEDLASTRAARKLYEQATQRDPALVAAWIGHMWTLQWELWFDFATGRDERLLAEMDRDSRRAVALDDRDPQAWHARAHSLRNQWQWGAAFEAMDRARALDPTRFNLLLTQALLFISTGRSAEALKVIETRNKMMGTPDSDFLFLACHAHVHLAQYEEAISKCGRAVANDENEYWLYLDLAAAYAQTGDMVKAAAAKAQLMRRVPDFTIARLEAKQFSNHPIWIEEIRTHFIPGLRKVGVPE
jgi:tetratricopeptide (TPR) repeat protein